ncbi:MAG: dihydroneopterin aldolase [Bacteroidota bacterium]
MAEIALEGIEFEGFHGLYADEKVKGNTFILDIKAFGPQHAIHGPGQPTLGSGWPDYGRIYALAEAVFLEPRDLLEEVIAGILMALRSEWSDWTFEVSLANMNPPILCRQGPNAIRIPSSRVTMRCSDLVARATTS